MSFLNINVEQGTPEWLEERAGAITASNFAEVRKRVNGLSPQMEAMADAMVKDGLDELAAAEKAGYSNPEKQAKAALKNEKFCRALEGERVGDFTSAAQNYAFLLACERIAGQPLATEQFETWAQRRGRELEPQARAVHEFEHHVQVDPTGIVLTEDRRFGASADGLIHPDGGAEYKCFISPESIRPIMLENSIDEQMDQVQGGLWITGRQWWHFALYCPALEAANKHFILYEVWRDDDYIEALEKDLLIFDKLVEDFREKILQAETIHTIGGPKRADELAEKIPF